MSVQKVLQMGEAKKSKRAQMSVQTIYVTRTLIAGIDS